MAETGETRDSLSDPAELVAASCAGSPSGASGWSASSWRASRRRPGGRHDDPLAIGGAFFEMTARMMADPAAWSQAQMSLWKD